MEMEKKLWPQLKESNAKLKTGLATMTVGLGALAASAVMGTLDRVEVNGEELINTSNALQWATFLGGCAMVLGGQQLLIRGSREDLIQKAKNPNNINS